MCLFLAETYLFWAILFSANRSLFPGPRLLLITSQNKLRIYLVSFSHSYYEVCKSSADDDAVLTFFFVLTTIGALWNAIIKSILSSVSLDPLQSWSKCSLRGSFENLSGRDYIPSAAAFPFNRSPSLLYFICAVQFLSLIVFNDFSTLTPTHTFWIFPQITFPFLLNWSILTTYWARFQLSYYTNMKEQINAPNEVVFR